MKNRYLHSHIEALCFSAHKMAFVSGPRQCGKTTLAKMLLRQRGAGAYFNWDAIEFRRAWAKSPASVVPTAAAPAVPLLILDELHKERRWKRNLKGLYDTLASPCDILVTGSARLAVYAKGSDSLLGRYFRFRLHPFSLREMNTAEILGPDEAVGALFARARPPRRDGQERLESLMTYGPFPEPLFGQNARKARLWRQSREELVIREDLRDLTRLPDLSRVEMLAALLPERIGSPFSAAAMREDLEASFDSVKRWMDGLKELYYLFDVKPYSRKVPRSLRREGKVYLWDFAAVPDRAARFENLVASHLLKACHYWTDTGEGDFDLFCLRNKDKQEIDFLIVRDGVPWLPVEVKLSDTQPSPNWKKFLAVLPCRQGIQLVFQPHWQPHRFDGGAVLVTGAAEALDYLV